MYVHAFRDLVGYFRHVLVALLQFDLFHGACEMTLADILCDQLAQRYLATLALVSAY